MYTHIKHCIGNIYLLVLITKRNPLASLFVGYWSAMLSQLSSPLDPHCSFCWKYDLEQWKPWACQCYHWCHPGQPPPHACCGPCCPTWPANRSAPPRTCWTGPGQQIQVRNFQSKSHLKHTHRHTEEQLRICPLLHWKAYTILQIMHSNESMETLCCL